jgi:ribosomal-protein-alanine N-acetyltransferase
VTDEQTRHRAQRLGHLALQRRAFDRLDWWSVTDWAGSDALVLQEDIAVLIVPLDTGPYEALKQTYSRTAWLRWSAVADAQSASQLWRGALAEAQARLMQVGLHEVWCIVHHPDWIQPYMRDSGFEVVDHMLTFEARASQLTAPVVADVGLRRASGDDLDALCQLDASVFEEPWRYPAAIMRRAQAQAPLFTVAEEQGALIGYQCTLVGESDAHMVRLAVRADRQGRGVGRALLADACTHLTRLGAGSLTLNTQQSNQTAQGMYRHMGFRLLAERPAVWRKRLDALPLAGEQP